MNIREHAQAVIRVYLNALTVLEADFSNSERAKEDLEKSKEYLHAIAMAVDHVVDGVSADAANLQTTILDLMGNWALQLKKTLDALENPVPPDWPHPDFVAIEPLYYFHYYALKSIVGLAQDWASLPDPNVQGQTKRAAEGTYITYKEAMENEPHKFMRALAEYPKAVFYVKTFSSFLLNFRMELGLSSPYEVIEHRNELIKKIEELEFDCQKCELLIEQEPLADDARIYEQIEHNMQEIMSLEEKYTYLRIYERLENVYYRLDRYKHNKFALVSLVDCIHFPTIQEKLINAPEKGISYFFIDEKDLFKDGRGTEFEKVFFDLQHQPRRGHPRKPTDLPTYPPRRRRPIEQTETPEQTENTLSLDDLFL